MINPDEFSRWAELSADLARESLTSLPSSNRPWFVALGLSLLDPPSADHDIDWSPWCQLWLNPDIRVDDEQGHSRPAYRPLLLHLGLRVLLHRDMNILPHAQRDAIITTLHHQPANPVATGNDTTPDLQLWSALLQWEQAALLHDDQQHATEAQTWVDSVLSNPGDAGSLHPMSADESLDAWTFRELIGLHALSHLDQLHPAHHWHQRLCEIAAYHLENTQPDNTTNQPWGLPAFVLGNAPSLAEQQLHDVRAHAASLPHHRPPLFTGLLLADAAYLLSNSV